MLAMLDRRKKPLGAAASIFTAIKEYIAPAGKGSCEVRFTLATKKTDTNCCMPIGLL
jgi:hypothetical protein